MLTLLPFPYHNFDAASKFSIIGTEPNTFYSLNDYVNLQKNGNSKQFDLYIMELSIRPHFIHRIKSDAT